MPHDPEKILDQAVEDMQGDLIRLRQAAAEVTAAQRRLEAKRASAAETAAEWYRRAELALGKGDEELAREALARRKSYAATAAQLEGQLAAQGKAVSTITGNMRMLEGKLQEARLKKDTLKARAQSARSARQIQDMVAGINTGSALGAFEKMEERVMAMESEAEAAALLAAPDEDLESRFKALEAGNVDDDLAELRQSLAAAAPRKEASLGGEGRGGRVLSPCLWIVRLTGKVGTHPFCACTPLLNHSCCVHSSPPCCCQLPPGRPVKEAIDHELEELRRNRRYY
ncbi:hypothetical protein QBZ16_001942 [Prototheca wickerhamii]|uniref:Uncharacterized protein n=1 Tax=Prototheca wickerhamii TaxID=3111 RepID=A0AAD9MMF2_PROWI|nr:hypothetical protein QBZ16_001942 [Prototheca wickerhamii]